MSFYREIPDVIEAVRNGKGHKKCALLIGAGCSVTSGIPLAGEFVELIKRDWKEAYSRAAAKSAPNPPGYPACMAELSAGERRRLTSEFVDKASVNWAHIAIAQLMKDGFVDRAYTTNFDPLVLRACSMVNLFPAVYDFAASQNFKPAFLPDKAVFHLHGQHTGFVLLHTKE
jgi:NAD-dependent SIR2 family protein deacetylase